MDCQPNRKRVDKVFCRGGRESQKVLEVYKALNSNIFSYHSTKLYLTHFFNSVRYAIIETKKIFNVSIKFQHMIHIQNLINGI